MTASQYPWPPLKDGVRPEWTGSAFRVGNQAMPVLSYGDSESGWSDHLTQMHEELAGADHPMDALSRSWALRALRRHVTSPAPVVLEMGCSSGFFLNDLRTAFPSATLIGSDFLKEPLHRLATRVKGLPLLQFDVVRCPLPETSVDAAVLLNVLEHVEDDREAVRQTARILKPGGIAVIEVPAGPHLFDVYDEHLRHYRRYSSSALTSLAVAAGLTVVERSHLGCLAYPAFALVKRRNQRFLAAHPEAKQRLVEATITRTTDSGVLRLLLRGEEWLGRRMSFPFGIRCVLVCQRPRAAAA
jgi:SAM-dependent methyltransferase